MAVLVTGASGFVGWHLARALRDRGERVLALVRTTSKVEQLRPLGVEFVYGNVRDVASLQQASRNVELVFHLAGLTRAVHRQQLTDVNAEGSRNVASACAENGVKTLVSVSSLAAVGPSPDGAPVREDVTPRPVSDYGRSKLAGERAVVAFAGRVDVSIVRPPIVIGEYDVTSLEMFKSIHKMRVHVVPGFRSHPFSVVHATDVARLLIRAAEQGERCGDGPIDSGQGIYFADGGDRPTYAEMGELIGAALDRRFLKLPIGPRILRVLGALTDIAVKVTGRPRFLSSDKVAEATVGPWICSAEKARRQLGFEPQSSIHERFEQTARWYLENGWL